MGQAALIISWVCWAVILGAVLGSVTYIWRLPGAVIVTALFIALASGVVASMSGCPMSVGWLPNFVCVI